MGQAQSVPKGNSQSGKTNDHTTVSKNPGPKGSPNSSVDIIDNNGTIRTRRWYDANGNAYRDVDMTNHGNPKKHPEYPHEHRWTYKDGKVKITGHECYPQNILYNKILSEEYCWLSGVELTEMIEYEDYQWIWGCFQLFQKKCLRKKSWNMNCLNQMDI